MDIQDNSVVTDVDTEILDGEITQISNDFSETYYFDGEQEEELEMLVAKAMKLGELYERKKWQAAKAQAVPEWISTSERMPEEGEEVLVHNLGQVRQVTRDSKWAGGFKERNCYGWQAAYSQSHWMPKSIELPEQYHFYYENDAKQKAMIEAQELAND